MTAVLIVYFAYFACFAFLACFLMCLGPRSLTSCCLPGRQQRQKMSQNDTKVSLRLSTVKIYINLVFLIHVAMGKFKLKNSNNENFDGYFLKKQKS